MSSPWLSNQSSTGASLASFSDFCPILKIPPLSTLVIATCLPRRQVYKKVIKFSLFVNVHICIMTSELDPSHKHKQSLQMYGRHQMRPYTTANVMNDELETTADQQHQELTFFHARTEKKSLTWVGIKPTTFGLDHRCSTDCIKRTDWSRSWEFQDKSAQTQAKY